MRKNTATYNKRVFPKQNTVPRKSSPGAISFSPRWNKLYRGAVSHVPDSTTLMDFRHLLEKNALPQAMPHEVNELLKERGLLMSQGTLIDATFIAAPSSTKNKPHQRDPAVSTAANVSDISQTANLMHGEETYMGGDAGYVGVAKREEVQAKLQGRTVDMKWRIAKRRKPFEQMAEGWQKDLALAYKRLKARIRAKVEHPFHVVKNIFQHQKTRYKGIAKSDAQLHVLFALSNLYMVRGKLCPS